MAPPPPPPLVKKVYIHAHPHWLKVDSTLPLPVLVQSAESGQRICGCQMVPPCPIMPPPPPPHPSRKAGGAHDKDPKAGVHYYISYYMYVKCITKQSYIQAKSISYSDVPMVPLHAGCQVLVIIFFSSLTPPFIFSKLGTKKFNSHQ